MSIRDGASKSHEAHESHIQDLISEKDLRLSHIKNKDCVSYKINIRTLDILNPFWSGTSSWLTIGDYNGLEANYLLKKGQQAVASDISDAFLSEAHKEGLIGEYSKQNVEHLSYVDSSFDYVMCREAYHHFPRAYLGLYEMIRVSRKAVILVEPIDILSRMPALLGLKNILDKFDPLLINKLWKNRFSFEKVGNYVFKVSEREVEKVAMGIGLPMIAFRGINNITNVKENVLEVPINKSLYGKLMRKVNFLNFLAWLGLIPYNSICCIIFKELPDSFVNEKMKELHYKIIPLPGNPYLK